MASGRLQAYLPEGARLMERASPTTPEFNDRYRVIGEPAMRRAERRVIGSDYGATSCTTKQQAGRLAELLRLGPDRLLLDVGTGAGWPGVYLADTTGCDIVLADLPFEGLTAASARMRDVGVDGAIVNASGEALPFKDGVFDAVTSSDVFC